MSFSVGDQFSLTFSVSKQDMTDFASLSGDHNPIHLDDAYARENGFDGRVVYGALLISKLSTLIGMHLGVENVMWLYNSLKFKKPVYIDDSVEIKATVSSYSDSVQMAEFEIVMIAKDIKVCTGKIGVKVL